MKIFKKVLCLLLVCTFAIGTLGVVNADMAFADLSAGHWAYSYVQTLVGDGTINGYTDGTFRPNNNVTRAEFVKMIGKTDKSFDTPFADINGHWAYDYIMYSDMDVEGTTFNPDVPITRNDVINLLWKRAGSPEAVAPSIITNQSTKAGAAAWAYSYGIMNGDDGVNLRLQDGVTRAEASALICRSRTIDYSSKKVFADTVNPKIIEEVYNAFNLFGDEYNANRTFTNGEIAGAVMKLAYDTEVPLYDGLYPNVSVDRPNTFDFHVACNHFWGTDRMTEEFYDADANILDTVAALAFASYYKTRDYVIGKGDVMYDDVKSITFKDMELLVSSAIHNGIRVENSNNLRPNDTITAKTLALLLMQFDAVAGFNTKHYVVFEGSTATDSSLKTEIMSYPNSADKYKFILSDVPNEVYDSPFIDVDGSVANSSPKDIFSLTRDRYDIFSFICQQYIGQAYANGAEVAITYYPSLVCKTDNGYVMKVKVEVLAYEDGKTFDDIFANIISGPKPALEDLPVMFLTLATGSEIRGTVIPMDKAVFTSIDYIY